MANKATVASTRRAIVISPPNVHHSDPTSSASIAAGVTPWTLSTTRRLAPDAGKDHVDLPGEVEVVRSVQREQSPLFRRSTRGRLE